MGSGRQKKITAPQQVNLNLTSDSQNFENVVINEFASSSMLDFSQMDGHASNNVSDDDQLKVEDASSSTADLLSFMAKMLAAQQRQMQLYEKRMEMLSQQLLSLS